MIFHWEFKQGGISLRAQRLEIPSNCGRLPEQLLLYLRLRLFPQNRDQATIKHHVYRFSIYLHIAPLQAECPARCSDAFNFIYRQAVAFSCDHRPYRQESEERPFYPHSMLAASSSIQHPIHFSTFHPVLLLPPCCFRESCLSEAPYGGQRPQCL